MLKSYKTYVIFIALAVMLGGCAVPADKSGGDGRPVVYASFYPIYDLAKKAAGDFAEVRCLIPDNAEPHDWEPSPKDIAGLKGADLFFYSGAGFEPWVSSVMSGLGEGAPVAVETSLGIETEHHDEDENHIDSHVWLSPRLAKAQFMAMCDALAQNDPENAAGYDKNRELYGDEFDKLIAEFETLKNAPKKAIVVVHGAFGYMCRDYGITQIAASGYSAEDEPDPARMAEVIALAKENGVTVVFYEESAHSGTAKAIANEIGAEVMPLSTLEGISGEERANGSDYFSIMRKNLDYLKEALS